MNLPGRGLRRFSRKVWSRMLVYAVFFGLGLVGGFLSGLVGLGGAVFMVPLILYVPPLVQGVALSVDQVTAVSMVQVLAASLSGVIHHWQHRSVDRNLLLVMGPAMFAGAFGGGLLSDYVPGRLLLGLFATLATAAAVLFFLPVDEPDDSRPPCRFSFNRPAAGSTALGTGCLGGLVGAGGGIVLIPVMVHLFRIPTRVAVGTNLGIVLLSAAAGLLGKEMMTLHVYWLQALALVAGALPGAQAGAHVSSRVHARLIRILVHLIVTGAAARMWYQVFAG